MPAESTGRAADLTHVRFVDFDGAAGLADEVGLAGEWRYFHLLFRVRSAGIRYDDPVGLARLAS